MLGRLQFRGVWRQEQQVDMLGYVHLGTVVPASAPSPLSSTSTICLVGLAPTAEANASSSTEKSSMFTVVARRHTVRPEAGCTNPTR